MKLAEIQEMDNELLSDAVVEALGFTYEKNLFRSDMGRTHGWLNASTGQKIADRPNYTQDLNAMHEVEGSLTPEQQLTYEMLLAEATSNWIHSNWPLCYATARQRAEAFVLTKDKS